LSADVTQAGSSDVLVVGDVNLDVLVRPEQPIECGTDVSADIRQGSGGAGANVAVGLARLGRSVTLAGCVGATDSAATTDRLLRAGVRLALRAVSDLTTGAIVAIIDPDGERSMASDRGANLALRESDLPDSLIARHRHLHVSGYTLFGAGTRSAALAAIGRAIALGRTVSIDPASVAPLRHYGVANFLADVDGVDLLLPNTAEALALSGALDVGAAAVFLATAFPVVAVTCGAEGAVWADSAGLLRQPASPRTSPVLDTTGAGDAFTAGLLAAWLSGQSPTKCLLAGQDAAADAVTRWGAQ